MSKKLFPTDRRKVSNIRGFDGRNPLEHIDKMGVGIDPMQTTGDKQRLNLPKVFRRNLRPAKEPALPPHRNRSLGRRGIAGYSLAPRLEEGRACLVRLVAERGIDRSTS